MPHTTSFPSVQPTAIRSHSYADTYHSKEWCASQRNTAGLEDIAVIGNVRLSPQPLGTDDFLLTLDGFE